MLDSTDVYFYPYKQVFLNASVGTRWDWEPKTNLSDSTARSPYLTGYDNVFQVTVWDKYDCPFNEKFNILIDCDKIYPDKNNVALDTTLEKRSEILLTPLYGKVDSVFSPLKWLSCSDGQTPIASCQTPVANPENSIAYTVRSVDNLGCLHYESFNINVELFVPNVITPNGDGYNDCFKIIGLPDNTTLKVFDKNGIQIFSAKPYNESNWWTGTDSKGKPLETGTYWYVLDKPESGLMKKGFIFLKR
jgi:gliding motility-associated-like protein